MRTYTRFGIPALIAVFALAFAASAASALRSIEVRGGERGVTAESVLTFGEERLGPGSRIICPVTLLRTVNRAISKTPRSVIGEVTGVSIRTGEPRCEDTLAIGDIREVIALRRAAESSCTGGNASLCTVRWPLIYREFLGTLPEITGVRFHISNAQFQFNTTIGLNCLYAGDPVGLIAISRRSVTGASADSAATIMRRVSGSGLCPFETATFAGNFIVRPALTIALI